MLFTAGVVRARALIIIVLSLVPHYLFRGKNLNVKGRSELCKCGICSFDKKRTCVLVSPMAVTDDAGNHFCYVFIISLSRLLKICCFLQ